MNKTAKDLWKPKRRIELLYQRSLRRLMKELERRLKGINSLNDILRTIKKFTQSKEFQSHAEAEAKKMVTSVFTDAGKTWRSAANENGKGRQIYEALKHEVNTTPIGESIRQQTERNAKLITGIPEKVSEEITDYITKRSQEGRRAKDISEELQSIYPNMFKSKVDLIARTETSKASAALTRARSENIGINWYEWNTSEDSRVRSSHKHMDTVLIKWDDPPSPELLDHQKRTYGKYHAGEIFNCRCYAAPVIRLDFITWPHKVYYNGQIVRMSRKQFESIM